MANEWDPAAPLGWGFHGNNRRPHNYPSPEWYEDVNFYTRTDPNAYWWFVGRFQNHRQQQQPQLPPPSPSPPSTTPPGFAPVHVAPVTTSQPSQQHQTQPQSQPQLHHPPIFPPPAPGQVLIRHDRTFGCLLCAWTGDRRGLVEAHFLNRHQGVTAQENFNWTDWGSIRPRYR